MGDLSKNFNRSEFGCKCNYDDCVDIAVDSELVDVIQDVRNFFNKTVIVTCSYRCPKHNKDVGGVENSQHLLGTGADIVVKNVDQKQVSKYLDEKYSDKYGVGAYSSFTHIDVRKNKARWGF